MTRRTRLQRLAHDYGRLRLLRALAAVLKRMKDTPR
jgi:hypothetical protein